MLCPACKSVMTRTTSHGCPIRYCIECRGVWVSGEVLSKLVQILSWQVKPAESKKQIPFKTINVTCPHQLQQTKTCPECELAMQPFNYAYDSNIILDRCSTCNGVWLDPGELIKVVRHSQYDPEMHSIARNILSRSQKPENNAFLDEWLYAVFWILVRIVFRV